MHAHYSTALMIAAGEGHIDLLSVLVKRGANVELKDEAMFKAVDYAMHCNLPE